MLADERLRPQRPAMIAEGRSRSPPARAPAGLPAVVREGLVGLRHAEDVVLALVGPALLRLGVEQLACQARRHLLLAAAAGEFDQPAHRERAGTPRRNLDRYLVGGAADAARADRERGRQDLDRLRERLDRVLAGLLREDRQRVVDDPLGGRLLAVEHHLVDDLLHEPRAVHGVGLERTNLGGGATGHQTWVSWEGCAKKRGTTTAS